MPEYAVYITDHSDFPDKDVFYVFTTETIEDALAEAQYEVDEIRQASGALLRTEFAIPFAAARLAVDAAGLIEIRASSELSSCRSRLQR